MPSRSGFISSALNKIKFIKIPVFQFILYSSMGYLTYCFYQDYKYKMLLQQIHQQSGNQKQISNPLKMISQLVHKLDSVQGKRQLKIQLKDIEYNTQKYFVDPYKVEHILDFQLKKVEKSQQQKIIWWLKPYISISKLARSFYYRTDITKQGTFGIFFWLNNKTEQKNEILKCDQIEGLIQKTIQIRNQKCQQFSIMRKQSIQSKDMQILQCLNDTSREVASLQKMKERLRTIYKFQFNKE